MSATQSRFSAERSLSRQWTDDHASADYSAFRRGIDGNNAPVYLGEGRDEIVGNVTYARLWQDHRRSTSRTYPHAIEIEGQCETRVCDGDIGIEKIILGVSDDTGAITVRRIHLSTGHRTAHPERVLQIR